MFIQYSLWKICLLFLSSIHLTTATTNNRENLALFHPCTPLNLRLKPYIKWTENLASTQHTVQKDACGQTRQGPACCTNEVFNSYALSLAFDVKNLCDVELSHLTDFFTFSKRKIDIWIKEYITESRRITISSLETLFGTKEYHLNVQHSTSTLFNILGANQSTNDDVSKAAVDLFNHLIISSYRRFMTIDNHVKLDEDFQKCLVNKALDIEALPTRLELLYTLTSGAALIHTLRTLFIYIDADIQRLKDTVTINSNQCIQRYARETLCPICVSTPSSVHYDNNINEALCENDCRYVIKTCFNETDNPYVAFALLAQGYSNVIKQIQDAAAELKLIERLSKLHIYLYDMVVNATDTQHTYTQLQNACPNPNGKPFSRILSLPPIITERRELVTKWNESLHFMLDQFRTSINNLNTSLTQQIITEICTNSNYSVKSNRCTQIDQHRPGDFTQWPLPPTILNSQSNVNAELTRNQLDELEKKILPVQQMVISLRPKKKIPIIGYVPDFEAYDSDEKINDYYIQQPQSVSSAEAIENDNQESLSGKIYNDIDGTTTRTHFSRVYNGITRTTARATTTEYLEEKDANQSQSTTYNFTSYLIAGFTLIIHRLWFTCK